MITIQITTSGGDSKFHVINDHRQFDLTTDEALRISNNNQNIGAVWPWVARGLNLTKKEEENIRFINDRGGEYTPEIYTCRAE
ncbi:hypothetical protein [Ammoniphilus sp. 3BR4]|uniref:hypothetical protein n=1 Tax=Ammoniphilus sp. 3BR4 TaxID=3158265 RepID=UPI0034661801